MAIIRTIPTENYTVTSNEIDSAGLSAEAVGVWFHFVIKHPNWKFNAREVKRHFKIGMSKVYRIMRELIAAGYVTCTRIQSACVWIIYGVSQTGKTAPTAQATHSPAKTATSRVESHRVNFEHVGNECVLESTESSLKEQQPVSASAPILKDQKPVVVSLENSNTQRAAVLPSIVEAIAEPIAVEAPALIYPPQIAPKEIPAAKAIIAKAPLHLRQEVLTYLADMIIGGGVLNPMGYLTKLVASANNGTFAVTQAAGATKPDNPSIAKTQAILSEYRKTAAIKPDVGRGFMPGIRAALRGNL